MALSDYAPFNWPLFAGLFGSAQRRPQEVQSAPPDRVKPDEQARTGGQYVGGSAYLGGAGYVSSATGAACQPPCPAGDYPVWDAMDADPALTLARAVITSQIREAEKSYEAVEGTPEERVKVVQDCIDPLWNEYIRESLNALSKGWKPFEPVFGRREGRTIVADLKPLAQELTTYLVSGGVFAGLRNETGVDGKRVDLPPLSCLVVTIDGKNRNPYGRPWHENCRESWWHKVLVLRELLKLNRKGSGIQPKVFYPPAGDEETNHTNEKKAKAVAAAYMSGDGAVLPNVTGSLTPELAADFRNIQGMAEAALWKIEIEDHGSIGPQAAAMLDQLRYFNVELCRGWHVPERAAQEANQAGSRADSETSADTATAMSQLVFNDVCDALSRGPVDTILVENYGEAARGSVKVKAGKLNDVFALGDWKLIDAVLAQPDLFAAVAEQVDLDAVFTRRGIPKNKGVLTLTDAIKQRREQRDALAAQQAAPPKPVNGAPNGAAAVNNGAGPMPRLAMARGVEWLGRVLGGEDGHDE